MMDFPPLVEAIEREDDIDESHPAIHNMIQVIKEAGGDSPYLGGLRGLYIVEVTGPFSIEEYDGAESIRTMDQLDYRRNPGDHWDTINKMRLGDLRHFMRHVESVFGAFDTWREYQGEIHEELARKRPRVKKLRLEFHDEWKAEHPYLPSSTIGTMLWEYRQKTEKWGDIRKEFKDLAKRGRLEKGVVDILQYLRKDLWPHGFTLAHAWYVLENRWPHGVDARVDTALEIMMFLPIDNVEYRLESFLNS